MTKIGAREKLIEAALDTLHRRGFNATGVQDIADAAGVPKGSVYYHFASKEALGVEVLSRYWLKSSEHILAILHDQSLPPLIRLRRYFAALAGKLGSEGYAAGCLVGNFTAELADQCAPIRERLAGLYQEWTQAVRACLDEAQAAGSLPGVDSQALAGFLIAAWEGAVLRSKVERDGTALAQFQTITFTRLLG
jgi:TetR/AcrR family transcriptional repressor of nem operon